MKRKYLIWNDEEENFLRQHFFDKNWTFLCSNLRGRGRVAILKRAQLLGLERKIDKRNDMSALLEETPEAYYWIGFLMADGSFTDRRITLAMATKDEEQLVKFKNFVKSTNKLRHVTENYRRLVLTSVNEVKALRDRFGIHNNKTYNPCNISIVEDKDLLFSLIIGFMDGDGSIVKSKICNFFTLSVVGHPSWIPNFQFMKTFLSQYFNENDTSQPAFERKVIPSFPQNKINTKEFTTGHFYICNQALIRKIKQKADELKLPYLQRKLGQVSNS